MAVSKSDVFTPPIVPLRGDVEAEDGGDLDPELFDVVSVEYGEVDFFSEIGPRVAEPAVVVADDEEAVVGSRFCVCA